MGTDAVLWPDCLPLWVGCEVYPSSHVATQSHCAVSVQAPFLREQRVGGWLTQVHCVLLRQVTAPTELLYFSLNQGQCWYTVRLEEAIDVQNIRCSII